MSKIEWTEETWNPVTGCTKVSEGCRFCYAESMHRRFSKRPFTEVLTHEDRLDHPFRWKKPRRVFVNSMSDLFHPDVPDTFIDYVFAAMAMAPQHTFQILTKRPERMREYLRTIAYDDKDMTRWLLAAADFAPHGATITTDWPMPNIWLGVSVEDQKTADQRLPLLLDTPAAVRFVSAEPLLGPVDLCMVAPRDDWHINALDTPDPTLRLNWVIVGGESGPSARPCNVAWIRSLVNQCAEAKTPCFVKQMGASAYAMTLTRSDEDCGHFIYKVGRWNFTTDTRNPKAADPAEWPLDLRVREMPRS